MIKKKIKYVIIRVKKYTFRKKTIVPAINFVIKLEFLNFFNFSKLI